MEKFTEKITSMLQDKLSLYQELRSVLEAENHFKLEIEDTLGCPVCLHNHGENWNVPLFV